MLWLHGSDKACVPVKWLPENSDHVFRGAHQQMHLHFIVGKSLPRALPRSSTEGMKVAWLAGVLTQPPTRHTYLLQIIWSAEVVANAIITAIQACSCGLLTVQHKKTAQTDDADKQTAHTDCAAWS